MSETTPCYVYRSNKYQEMYLFLAKEDDFECIPDEVRKGLGQLEKALELDLTPETRMARSNAVDVIKSLKDQGFHIQMPPKTHELVEEILKREADKSQ